MDIQLFFEFESAERKPIALTVNGVSVGLQTTQRSGTRIYAHRLPEYKHSQIELTLISLGQPTNVTIIVQYDSKSLSHQVYLPNDYEPVHVKFDLERAGWIKKTNHVGQDPEGLDRLSAPDKTEKAQRPNGGPIARTPIKGILKIKKNVDFKIDFDFYDNQTKKADLLAPKAEEVKSTMVEVFYATDRAREDNKKGKITYKNERGDLELGKCQVNVPGNRKKGELPLPPWYYFGLYVDEEKHMVIKAIDPLGAEAFFSGVQAKVAASPEKDAFVFLHGFNVGFEESIMRAALMTVDIGFRGAPIVYSWPSLHKIGGYMADEATVTGYSLDNVIQLIKDVRQNTGAERVHLIAHSMGGRLLTEALKVLVYESFTKKFLFNQVILAAPDIDAEVFVKHIAPKISGAAERVTLYTSLHDKALWLSEKLHGDNLRLGTAGEELAVCAGIDTIDASGESTGLLGHGYFAESKALIDDIYHATRFNHTPEERNLRKRLSGKLFYWDFN